MTPLQPLPVLDDAKWQRVRELHELLRLVPLPERRAWLVAHESDKEVLTHIGQLMGSIPVGDGDNPAASTATPDAATSWLGWTPPVALPVIDTEVAQARAGQLLGHWMLQGRIGVGGMGEVFAARRVDGRYDGLAAIKLMRNVGAGVDMGGEVLQRFAAEQQSLARLNHPHIARLLDAGQSEQGEPYFVMELVEGGVPITEACASLPLQQRLKLFEQLTSAVAHAHSRLLIHRDLKPSNVLVDRNGALKLVDFGIAKAMGPAESAADWAVAPSVAIEATVQGHRPFTPAYASPEQVRGEPVTTSTDIYSLGVLLYTVLTGQRPYGHTATTPQESAQAVLHETPCKPSEAAAVFQALATVSVGSPTVSIDRTLLKGDLDAIVLKALSKSPEDRYSSVEAMAADLKAFTAGYPVSACVRSRGYVVKKWLKRHTLGASLGAVAIVAVMTATAGALWQAHQAEQARALAQQHLGSMKDVTREVLYSVGSQIEFLPGGQAIRGKMLQNLADNLEKLAVLPSADHGVQQDAAQAWSRMAVMQVDGYGIHLGANDLGKKSAERAIFWFEKTAATQNQSPSFAISWGESWRAMAGAERAKGDLKTALQAWDKQTAILQSALARWPQDALLQHALGSNQIGRGQLLGFSMGQIDASHQQLQAAQATFKAILATPGSGGAKKPSAYHQLGVGYGSEALLFFRAGDDASAAERSALAVEALEEAVRLTPDNVMHSLALGVEASMACASAVHMQLDQASQRCQRSDELHQAQIRKEPANPEWRWRAAMGVMYSASQMATEGRRSDAASAFGVAIGALDELGKSGFQKVRAAQTRVERAAITSGAASQQDLKLAKPLMAQNSPGDKDRVAWMMRARWFAVSATREGEASRRRELAVQANEAYAKADALFKLSNLHHMRWAEVQALVK